MVDRLRNNLVLRRLTVIMFVMVLVFTLMPLGNMKVRAEGISSWQELQDAISAGGEIKLTKDIVAEATDRNLSVSSTVVIDLNGHKIDRNLSEATEKVYVIGVSGSGSLTIKDTSENQKGQITGGYNNFTGGGIWFDSSGTLTLESGSISGNKSSSSGAGIDLHGTFIMTGGAIQDNETKNSDGGGLNVRQGATANLYGGVISGNKSSIDGGIFISDNTSVTVGGTIQIYDNTTKGEERNIFESQLCNVKISSDKPLSEGARIGVYEANDIEVDGLTADNIKYFTSDVKNHVHVYENGKYYTKPKTDTWTYSATGATLSAACNGECGAVGSHTCSLTYTASELTYSKNPVSYSGSASEGDIRITDNGWTAAGLSVPQTIKYYLDNEQKTETNLANSGASGSGQAPVDAGKYIAEITVGEGQSAATAGVKFEIKPAELTIGSVTLAEKQYDGTTAGGVEEVVLNGLKSSYDLIYEQDYSATAVYDNTDASGPNAATTATVTVTLSENVKNYKLPVNKKEVKPVSIQKRTCNYVVEGPLTAYVGQRLADVKVTSDKFEHADFYVENNGQTVIVRGRLEWENGDGITFSQTGPERYNLRFIPTDSNNYAESEFDYEINVIDGPKKDESKKDDSLPVATIAKKNQDDTDTDKTPDADGKTEDSKDTESKDTGTGKDNNTDGNGTDSQKTTSIKSSDDVKRTGSVTIPDTLNVDGEERTVTEISADAFNKEEKLEEVSMPDTIEKICRRAFKDCSELEKIEIGENVKQMNRSAFYGCKKLTSVELNDRLEYVGGYAFKKCTSLKSFTFGSGVKKLGRSIFSYCTSLESTVIPKSVESMGKNMFYGCKSLKTLTIETTKLNSDNLAQDVFRNVPKDLVIYVPKSKKRTYEKLFREKGLNSNVQIKAIGE